jgi:hypothetical protein
MQTQWYGFSRLVHSLCALSLLILATVVQAETTYRLDWASQPKTLRVGDVVELVIQGATAEVSELIPSKSLKEEGWVIQSFESPKLRLIPIKAGKLTVPELALKNKDTEMGKTTPLEAQVESAISPQDTQPDLPAEPESPLGLRFPVLVVAGLSVLGVALVLFIGYYLWKYWSRRPKFKPQMPTLPDHEIALKALRELEQKCEHMELKALYFGISDILKTYVGARYCFEALESTSREIHQVLETRELRAELVKTLDQLFDQLDRVKFTDYQPNVEESRAMLKSAQQWVEENSK